jgi:hypothetical protein
MAPAVRAQAFPPFGLLRLLRVPSRLAWRAGNGGAALLRALFIKKRNLPKWLYVLGSLYERIIRLGYLAQSFEIQQL